MKTASRFSNIKFLKSRNKNTNPVEEHRKRVLNEANVYHHVLTSVLHTSQPVHAVPPPWTCQLYRSEAPTCTTRTPCPHHPHQASACHSSWSHPPGVRHPTQSLPDPVRTERVGNDEVQQRRQQTLRVWCWTLVLLAQQGLLPEPTATRHSPVTPHHNQVTLHTNPLTPVWPLWAMLKVGSSGKFFLYHGFWFRHLGGGGRLYFFRYGYTYFFSMC